MNGSVTARSPLRGDREGLGLEGLGIEGRRGVARRGYHRQMGELAASPRLEDFRVGPADRAILRELGMRIAEVAALPEQAATRAAWIDLNGLRPQRPMVAIDQLPWHELADGEPSLAVHCEHPFARGYEIGFRRTLYAFEHMRADMVVDGEVLVPRVIHAEGGFGISMQQEIAAIDPRNEIVAHRYIDQLQDPGDVTRIRRPRIVHDPDTTRLLEESAREIFEGVLPVRVQGWVPGLGQWPGFDAEPAMRDLANPWPADTLLAGFNLWDIIAEWRSVGVILLDLVDRPEHMHAIIGNLTDAYLGALEDMESQGLLGWGQGTIHCSPAYTDELPHDGFDPGCPRAGDLWTMGMAQILTSVSPTMFRDFEVDYARRWYARFGLGYYGCCDVLDERIDIIRTIPNVRKISMSPWANAERGAESIGRDFVFSGKPNPAYLARDSWEPEAVERDLRATIEACRRHGTPLELLLKDVSTIRYKPGHLREWVDIAMRLVRE
jgi:hypothetical protein